MPAHQSIRLEKFLDGFGCEKLELSLSILTDVEVVSERLIVGLDQAGMHH